ncbi:MAG: hypothetical protein C0407_18590, partial [Desulfobacca sp.]|nr:hypothetical protein [Desulfobacca sp.]
MIKSMTGFAQTLFSDEKIQLTLSVRSYNSRFLDINFRLSSAFYPLEDRIRTYIASRIFRGRVEVSIQIETQEKLRYQNMTVNWSLAKSYERLLTELKKNLNIPGPIELSHLLSLKEVIVFQESTYSEEGLWKKLAPPLKQV